MTNTGSDPQKRLEIRKYPNRRYYDSTHSRHLTLEEIRSLVEQGYDIHVVDAKTEADITAQVLIQIIVELDTVKLDSLPVPLLVHLIRVNDQLIKNFIDNYLNKALEAFLNYQKTWQNQLRSAPAFPTTLPTMTAWTEAMLRPFSMAGNPAPSQPPPPNEPKEPASREDLAEALAKLQREVADLRNTRRGKPALRSRKTPARRPKK